MRKFSSYGPVNPKLHYYTPRENLIDKAYTNLIGENPAEGGHYITVWAPRQTGKSWLMQEILQKIQKNPPFDVVQVSLERLKYENNVPKVIQTIAEKIGERLGKSFPGIDTQDKFQDIFKIGTIDKPLILILPDSIILPPITLSPISFSIGKLSPVNMDSFTLQLPQPISASTGT